MRIWDITSGWVISLLLCCGCTAFGQAVSADVSSTVSAQAGGSAASASVNAGASGERRAGGAGGHAFFVTEATGQEATGQEEGSSAAGERHGGRLEGRGSAETGSTTVGGASSFRQAPFQLSASSASRIIASKRLSGSSRRQGSGLGYGFHGHNATSASIGIEAAAALAGSKEEQTQGSDEVVATYSAGFQDSTRGTALISPPDMGTASPLDWSPIGVDSEFPDMLQAQFLQPTLQVAEKTQTRKTQKQEKAGMNGALSDHMPSALQPSLSNQFLSPTILNPLDQFDQVLNPTILNPLGTR
jgi:hypothetical protein